MDGHPSLPALFALPDVGLLVASRQRVMDIWNKVAENVVSSNSVNIMHIYNTG